MIALRKTESDVGERNPESIPARSGGRGTVLPPGLHLRLDLPHDLSRRTHVQLKVTGIETAATQTVVHRIGAIRAFGQIDPVATFVVPKIRRVFDKESTDEIPVIAQTVGMPGRARK